MTSPENPARAVILIHPLTGHECRLTQPRAGQPGPPTWEQEYRQDPDGLATARWLCAHCESPFDLRCSPADLIMMTRPIGVGGLGYRHTRDVYCRACHERLRSAWIEHYGADA